MTRSGAKVGGDLVTYTVTATNTGDRAAGDAEVWDLLPPEVRCPDVSDLRGATCTPGPAPTPDRVRLVIPGPVAAGGGTASASYVVRLPGGATPTPPVAAGDTLTNSAGIRGYAVTGNQGTVTTYIPSSNIDPSLEPQANTSAANASSTVSVAPIAPAAKTVATGTTQPGNPATTATIGEVIDYTVALTVPAGTSVYSAVLRDPINASATYRPGSASVTFPDGTPYTVGSALPAGFTLTDTSGAVTLGFPPAYHNVPGSGDDTFTLRFAVTVDTGSGQVRGNPIPNQATFTRQDSVGSAFSAVASNQTSTRLVEPAVTVTKTNDAPAGAVGGGQTVTYTVTVANTTALERLDRQ